jgi:hypothetical protein
MTKPEWIDTRDGRGATLTVKDGLLLVEIFQDISQHYYLQLLGGEDASILMQGRFDSLPAAKQKGEELAAALRQTLDKFSREFENAS